MASIALFAATFGGVADAFVVSPRASPSILLSRSKFAAGASAPLRRREHIEEPSLRRRRPSSVQLKAVEIGSGAGSSIARNDTAGGGYAPTFDPLEDDLFSPVVDDALEKKIAAANVVETAGEEIAAIAAAAAAATASSLAGVDSEAFDLPSVTQGSVFFDDVVEEAIASADTEDAQARAGLPAVVSSSEVDSVQSDIGDSLFFDEVIEKPVGPVSSGMVADDAVATDLPPGSVLFDVIEEEEVQTKVVEPKVDNSDAPSVRQILRFAVSAIGVWLCSPILSMIDTSAVGLLAGTAQQAALNPAVSVTDYGGLLVAFMYTATTNLVSAAQETDRTDPAKPRTTRTVISAMRLGLLVGAGFGLTLSVLGRVLLRTLIGNDAIDPAVFSAALRYVRIRALGMPAAVVIGTAQSACLGMQDLKSPLYVLLAAAIINFLGDAIFVRSPSLWMGGAAGAAWATVFSQYAALAMFVHWFRTKSGDTRRRVAWTRAAKAANVASGGADGDVSKGKHVKGGESPPSRGFLSGRFDFTDLFRKPRSDIAKEFLPYVAPVTATSIGRISGYLAMSHVASSALGTVDMAAQQIILSFFCCLCPVSDSLNLTAQSFIPSIFARPWGKARANALRRAMSSFIRAGWIIGAALVALVSMIPFLGHLFTTDPAVLAQVNTAVPGVGLFFALSGFIMVGEGMFLGQRDLSFLGKIYGAFFFAVPAVLLRLKRRALAGLQDVGVGTMWTTFSAYQVVRFFIWAYRMKWLQRQRDAEGEPVAAMLRP